MSRIFSPEEHRRIVQMRKVEARRRQLALWAPPFVIAGLCTLVSVVITLVLLRNVSDTVLMAREAKGGVSFYGLKTTVSMLVALAVFLTTFALSTKIIARKKRP